MMADSAIKERPILMSAPMVRACLNDSKTQTRRVLKPQPSISGSDYIVQMALPSPIDSPYGKPGDRLWVRETHSIQSVDSRSASVSYRERMPEGKTLAETDGGLDAIDLSTEELIQADRMRDAERWRPSIFMPRWASRITPEITDVRVERLQDISEEDAIAEGCEVVDRYEGLGRGYRHSGTTEWRWAKTSYAALWNSINGAGAWDKNPWVWTVSFRRMEVR